MAIKKDAQGAEAQVNEAKAEEKPSFVEVPKARTDKLIKYHVWSAMAIGLVPLPLVDFAGITAIQLNLLRKLAKEYKVRFFKDKVKNILSALVGGAAPTAASGPVVASLVKLIPGVGTTVGVVTMPILAGASTYALGKVFLQHFASGGTFLTFDPEKVKDYYAEMVKEGQTVASSMKGAPAAE